MKNPFQRCVFGGLALVLPVLILLSLLTISAGADEMPTLFVPTEVKGTRLLPQEAIRASRTVAVNWKALQTLGAVQQPNAPAFQLTLLDGKESVIRVDRTEQRTPKQYSVFGHLDGEPGSLVLLTVYEDALAAMIYAPGKFNLALRSLGKGVYALCDLDEAGFGKCIAVSPQIAPQTNPPTRHIEATAQLDIMIVYTPAARNAAGGVNQIAALAQQSVDAANVCYQNSGVDAHMNLVYNYETNYTESGGFPTHLNRLTSTTDGVMDEVHAMRNFIGADLVSLLVSDDSSGGLAWTMNVNSTAFAPNAFSVVRWQQAVSDLTVAHETGHNLGCGHATGDLDAGTGAPASGLFTYSRGWRFNGDDGVQYRTVMAYAPGNRISNFSNPNVLVHNRATGVANSADNARTLNQTVGTTEQFRLPYSEVWVDFTVGNGGDGSFLHPFNRIEDGQNRVRVGGTVWARGTSPVTHPRLNKTMTVRQYLGNALIR